MEKRLLPVGAINSQAAVVVYSEGKNLVISEHESRAQALKSLAAYVAQEPETDAALYEREEGWRCILRCPIWHATWLDEATERLSKTHSGLA